MARPLIKTSQIRQISSLQCSEREAASFFKISVITFRKILAKDERAAQAWREGQDQGKLGLRRKQYRLATTNAQMAIFLGKQWLEQQDKTTQEVTGPHGGPIETMDLTKLNAEERKQLRSIVTRAARSEIAA